MHPKARMAIMAAGLMSGGFAIPQTNALPPEERERRRTEREAREATVKARAVAKRERKKARNRALAAG